MYNKEIYVVVKNFNNHGSIAYKCKSINEARCLPGTLEAIRPENIQVVILDNPEIYSEYAPYRFISNLTDFIKEVGSL